MLADITSQIAAEQAETAQWRYSVTNDFGEVVHHGRLRRRPKATHLALVKARDRRCRAKGCRQPVIGCDVDHTRDWAISGDSRPCNLGCICETHHRYKHETGITVWQLETGAMVWDTLTGQYLSQPWRHDIAD